jgi:hypothetical protein
MDVQPFVGPWALFQFLDSIHSKEDSLDWVSPRRKAATYKQNTNTELTYTDIHALNGILTHDPSIRAAETVHASDRAATVIISCIHYKGSCL